MLPKFIKTTDIRQNEFFDAIHSRLSKGIFHNKKTITSAYTVMKTDFYLGVNAGAITISLPPISALPSWFSLIIKDESGAAAANNITIDADGAETIDGSLTKVINSNYGILRIFINNNEWFTW